MNRCLSVDPAQNKALRERVLRVYRVAGLLLTLVLAGPAVSAEIGAQDQAITETAALSAPSERIVIVARATKIVQLLGDVDHETGAPTINQTWTRYKIYGADLGVPFRHVGRTYLLFGDTVGAAPRGLQAIAYTTDTTPEDGIKLQFLRDSSGIYHTVRIPGISLLGWEDPKEGTSVNGRMFIYCTTDHTTEEEKGETIHLMNRSVVAVSDDDGWSFAYLYDLSTLHFINVSIVEVDLADWSGFPQDQGTGLVIFGSGCYRQSDVRLAFQPAEEIESRASLRYFAGLGDAGQPTWSQNEEDAQALFHQPCVGEVSVSYNRFIGKWIMLYNCCCVEETRGINMRTADQPWGPWSEPQTIFDPWRDNGYCHFMHTNWEFRKCDSVHDENRENEWGGEYGPYQFEDLAIGEDSTTTIYFSMSTWNPYTIVLMKATLKKD